MIERLRRPAERAVAKHRALVAARRNRARAQQAHKQAPPAAEQPLDPPCAVTHHCLCCQLIRVWNQDRTRVLVRLPGTCVAVERGNACCCLCRHAGEPEGAADESALGNLETLVLFVHAVGAVGWRLLLTPNTDGWRTVSCAALWQDIVKKRLTAAVPGTASGLVSTAGSTTLSYGESGIHPSTHVTGNALHTLPWYGAWHVKPDSYAVPPTLDSIMDLVPVFGPGTRDNSVILRGDGSMDLTAMNHEPWYPTGTGVR